MRQLLKADHSVEVKIEIPSETFFASRGPGPILWWLNTRGVGRTDPKLRSNFSSLNGLFNFLYIHMIIIYKFTVFSPFCFKVIPWRLLNLTPLEPKCPSSLQHPPTPSEFYLPRWRWRWKRQSLGVSGNSRWLHSLKHLKDNGSTQLRQRFSQLPPGAPCVVWCSHATMLSHFYGHKVCRKCKTLTPGHSDFTRRHIVKGCWMVVEHLVVANHFATNQWKCIPHVHLYTIYWDFARLNGSTWPPQSTNPCCFTGANVSRPMDSGRRCADFPEFEQ